MCLSITIAARDDVNRTHFKRVLAGATSLSISSHDRGDSGVFLVGDGQCGCGLHVSGPNGDGRGIELTPSAAAELVKIAEALMATGLLPFELRVFVADRLAGESMELDLDGLRALAGTNSFDERVAYVVS